MWIAFIVPEGAMVPGVGGGGVGSQSQSYPATNLASYNNDQHAKMRSTVA